MKLGIYGGSFDPVHLGHLLVARAALEEFALDRLVFVPAAQSPFKPGTEPAPGAIRVRMLRLALAGETQFDVDEFELRRGGVSYTIDTVRHFQSRHPGGRLFLLIGADHVPTLGQWREAARLAESVEFLVIPRPGEAPGHAPAPFRTHTLRGWPLKVSSSEIRLRRSRGESIRHLLPPGIAETLAEHDLYRS